MALYLPNSVDFDSNCVVVLDNYTARVYSELPSDPNFTGDYIDFALDNHYLQYYGVEVSSNFPTSCYPSDLLTHSILDRTDISDIFIVASILIGFTLFILFKCLRWLFRGWF